MLVELNTFNWGTVSDYRSGNDKYLGSKNVMVINTDMIICIEYHRESMYKSYTDVYSSNPQVENVIYYEMTLCEGKIYYIREDEYKKLKELCITSSNNKLNVL